ncbi:hypothetical protein KUTeg_006810 [Tegillarca granosa]|uniref:Uncharacterized protein n=1 Tax=Tegillarca granosa TaxID=220873 RepID=A0ABQ9FBE7_TEGGR|nr:hypothetical protein KUTeg_006810 [Tegillarca granosa]
MYISVFTNYKEWVICSEILHLICNDSEHCKLFYMFISPQYLSNQCVASYCWQGNKQLYEITMI